MTEIVPVLINASGGTAQGLGDRCASDVQAAFDAAGLAVDVQMLAGDRIAPAAAKLGDRALVVVGGGDGTLGSAAGELAKGSAALGILPLGTRNHLARDLGIPADLSEAAKVIAARQVRRIDLARINDRVFVNNASIGAYPELVQERDRHHAPKWLATMPATLSVLRRLRHHRFKLGIDGAERRIATPLLFVGNNLYRLEAGHLGERPALDDGLLSVFAVGPGRRRDLLGFAIRTLLGRADPERDFAAMGETAALTVAGHPHHIAVALDGEVVRLPMPLRFSIQPRALQVVAPLERPGATA